MNRNDFWQRGQFSAGETEKRKRGRQGERETALLSPLALFSVASRRCTRGRVASFAFVLRATCPFFFFLRALRKRSLPFGESCVHRVSFLPLSLLPPLPSSHPPVPRICIRVRPARCTFVKVLALHVFGTSMYTCDWQSPRRSSLFPWSPIDSVHIDTARTRRQPLTKYTRRALPLCVFQLREPLSHFLPCQCKYWTLFAKLRKRGGLSLFDVKPLLSW